METLTHLDSEGKALMVDVSSKHDTMRTAIASGRILMNRKAFEAIGGGTVLKGDVLAAARIAGIMATKQTPNLIPLCHSLLLTSAKVDFRFLDDEVGLEATCTVETEGKTGVEMEALTGVSVALLTIYDFCKALDRGMQISDIRLLFKQGGKSGTYDKR
ncbi:molybdenum cofactor biosynthesis protein MoaC [Sphaerochaeta pleomorpha str. Grapes]|uniref:Cyclic pyranopterin monophosphate synthase n=1 Tax=Sphaerochaeta pleomorpha (strain ATCC BAA-1885 / DSM 22778 / Grapes) TaxID=158190 RepID=G8QTC0_SPHPG|nr:cyclic pyranopterin monophosphate synthase MoaC [Sphaerochaeta pleomorpha]AEV29087.1 molybdenum cofactor biosynthesis protein MoaC [Sphaerochaeta pleomorpha str. Grapes]